MSPEKKEKFLNKSDVNETKNLSQTFLSRSTDKVLQPRKIFRLVSLFLCKYAIPKGIKNNKNDNSSVCTGNKIKTVVLCLSPAMREGKFYVQRVFRNENGFHLQDEITRRRGEVGDVLEYDYAKYCNLQRNEANEMNDVNGPRENPLKIN